MRNIKKLYKVIIDCEEIVQLSNEYEQFTIDFFQNTEMGLNVEIDEDITETHGEDLIGNTQYEVSCILDIIKDGKDKDLFLQLENKIKDL